MSKIEAGRIKLELQTTDLTEIVEETLRLVEPRA